MADGSQLGLVEHSSRCFEDSFHVAAADCHVAVEDDGISRSLRLEDRPHLPLSISIARGSDEGPDGFPELGWR